MALANFLVVYKPVIYLEVMYFMWSRADKLPLVVLCTMICVDWILKGKKCIFLLLKVAIKFGVIDFYVV